MKRAGRKTNRPAAERRGRSSSWASGGDLFRHRRDKATRTSPSTRSDVPRRPRDSNAASSPSSDVGVAPLHDRDCCLAAPVSTRGPRGTWVAVLESASIRDLRFPRRWWRHFAQAGKWIQPPANATRPRHDQDHHADAAASELRDGLGHSPLPDLSKVSIRTPTRRRKREAAVLRPNLISITVWR